MKCKKITYNDFEGNRSPRVLLGRVLSEDDQFINFLTGKGKTYRINKNWVLSIEDSDADFILQGDAVALDSGGFSK